MAEIAVQPECARYSLRGDDAMLAAGCASFGLAQPTVLRATEADGRAALWLGPDEVLLLAASGTAAPAAGLAVDVSGRQVALLLDGPDSEAILAAGCPLDVAKFPVGACTRTLFGKAEIVLWRTAATSWRIEVWRSFAAYVQGLLAQAAKDWP